MAIDLVVGRTFHLASVTLALLSVPVAGSASAQDLETANADDDVYDLRVRLTEDAPVLVRIERETSGRSRFQGLEKEVGASMEKRFVDLIEATDEDGAPRALTRRYLRCRSTTNDGIRDNCLAGLTLQMERTDDEVTCSIEGGGWMPAPTLATQTQAFPSGGAWVDLPESVAIGEAFDLSFDALLVEIFAEANVENLGSEFELEGVDDGGENALVSGRLRWRSTAPIVTSDHEAAVSMTLDLVGHRIRRVELEGTCSFAGEVDGVAFEGDMTFDATLAVDAGEDARAALDEVPEMRAMPRSCTEQGVNLELPSSWESQPLQESSVAAFRWSRSEEPLLFAVGNSITPASLEVLARITRARMEAEGADFEMEDVTSPLGDGFAIELRTERQLLYTEFYHLGGARWVWIKIISSGSIPDEVMRDFEAARKSLVKL